MVLMRLFSLLIGYALGHIQTSYILGKTVKKIDIRDYGSKSSGMTNTLRVMGPKYAVVVILVDVMKSMGAYIICSAIFGGEGSFFAFGDGVNGVLPGFYGSVGAVLGHMFPVYMRLRGGKSIACGIGLILAVNLPMAAIILGAAMAIIAIFRFISLASIISAISLPFMFRLFGYPPEAVIIGAFLAVLLTYKHKDNIKRLLSGTENVVYGKKKLKN
ncbi:MAG: glycerol-3-phosphate 1-O-acyltransferase PlsY [Defluviitaleaceae bacterium]|nr:glycerol-3-phosphate 1-O-acyltransferase PlsY [Defluviitaleaceae bacterium]MCL2837037.1 glycerol-3-phosphate 1-O-acyltransferase PlsY [Defluviitaleaceae bacterium]